MRPYVKICCISSKEESAMAIAFGASAIGLVARMPSGPGPISDELIRQIASFVPPPVASFLLTCETRPEKIVQHHRQTLTSVIQLVDKPEDGAYPILREALPAVKLVQVIHILDDSSVEEALRVSGEVDALLLDSGNPGLKIKELGGTGRVHDWRLSRRICEKAACPVFLAGGLNPENVRRAIDEVQPFGIDVCSGVRTDGNLDMRKLERFMKEVG
ncbi:MAG: phosphoribosylanthranilate isomerase [Bacteroidota bacterium]